ncbi:EPIDERMAL PATTERNING FACTOR-like protein 3 [Raphanus sativus]|uniref:Epidermal patterning factor-like protein n=1 Tax=Raphanus sativus TaxID=3726 RepID=A0A6J0JRS8_RAPSA|nr:EPIDERMAL PATTERNING FACTOR-like protein 3 [Raphanus sativus]
MQVTEIKKLFMVTVVMIQIVSSVCATSRPIASNHATFYPDILSPHHSSNRPTLKPNERKDIEEMEKRRRIGSKPPTCEKKCYGCEPCEAIQVPTISSSPHLSPHYANYKPEGWRCHCAP